MNSLLYVITGINDAVSVPELSGLAEIHQVFVEDAHVAILHALFAHFYLVWVRVGLIHPLIFEAVGCGIFHGLILHVLKRHRQVDIRGVVFVE